MEDGPLVEKYSVEKKGYEQDPRGARYFVLDYVNDQPARVAARVYANCMSSTGKTTYANALYESLAGGEEDAVLRTYEVKRNIGEGKPGARYIVLNYVHSYPARVAMRIYINAVRHTHPTLASDLLQELLATEGTHAEYMESKNPKGKKRGRKKAHA